VPNCDNSEKVASQPNGQASETDRRNGNAPGGPPLGSKNALTHGLHSLKAAVVKLGGRAIDGRYHVGRELQKWRRELITDLGCMDNVSTQQNAIVEIAIKSKLLLDSIDAWLVTQQTLINKRKKAVLPVVLQRQQLADGLAKYMAMLGLERRHKVPSLNEILAESHEQPSNGKE
jgi:hypothetical protein